MENTSIKNIENAKVHLVLGSGGARGIAHIGVINELKRLNCEIVSVSGCSMGAVVGGIYCTGKLDVFTDWLLSIKKKDVFSLMDFTLSTSGLIKGEKILHIIEDLIGTYNIEELAIPFTAVATDLSNKKEVHYQTGNLYEAIRASVGIPTLFTPMIDHDKLLIDGGILNPLPISTVKKNSENEITVAVNLSAKPKTSVFHLKKHKPFINTDYFGTYKDKIESLFADWLKKEHNEPELAMPNIISILTQTIDLMQDQVTNQTINIHKPDVLVNIRRDFARTMDFHDAGKLIKEGARAFNSALNEEEKTMPNSTDEQVYVV
jgi:NTE family protein